MERSFFDGNESSSNLISLSNVYQVMQGGFGSGGTQITSYMTSTTVEHLKKDLITFETLLKDGKWPVSKVIQREVDTIRVDEISRNYIENSSDQIRYFPPIVVAILPRNGELFSDSYMPYENNDYSRIGYKKVISGMPFNFSDEQISFLINDEKTNISKAEGLFIKKPYSENCNYLAWDKNKYYAIVIDGQHRFEGLKKSSDKGGPGSPINSYSQDVIFIDASAKYFNNGGKISSISIFRKIFMDINKNPVLVSESKQIIMDDTDPAKLFVQAIVDDTDVSHHYLKPELIDWNTNSNKHELPYLTSVLNLHTIISDKFLAGKSLSSFDSRKSPETVKKWVNRLNDFLKVDNIIIEKGQNEIKTLRKSLEEFDDELQIDDDALFKYDSRVLNFALEQFKQNYIKSIVYFFNNLYIYKCLITFLESKGVFAASSDLRIALLKTSANRFESEDKEVKKVKHEVEATDFVRQFSILFSVVGQKALFDLYFTFLSDERNGILNEEHLYNITVNYVKKMNETLNFIAKLSFSFFGEYKQDDYKIYKKAHFGDKYDGISTYFWEDLLYFDDKISYNRKGVYALKSILNYISNCIENRDNLDSVDSIELKEYKKEVILKLKEEHSLSDIKADQIAQKFVDLKLSFIKHIVQSADSKK